MDPEARRWWREITECARPRKAASLFLDKANIKINSINIRHTMVGRKVAGVKGRLLAQDRRQLH